VTNEVARKTLRRIYSYVREVNQKPLNEEVSAIRHKVKHKVIPQEIINDLIKSTANDNLRLIVTVLINSGMRVSELISLNHYDASLESDTYYNYIKNTPEGLMVCVKGKGGRVRDFYLNVKISQLMYRHSPFVPGKPIFTNRMGKRITRFGINKLLKHEECKLQKKYPSLRSGTLHPHAFRHTYITLLKQKGVETIALARAVGHSVKILNDVYDHSVVNVNKGFKIGY
jgi:integrase/recombinase XerD